MEQIFVKILLAQNPNLNHLVEKSFQGVNRLFVLAFENEIKDYNVMIDRKNVFDQLIKMIK